MRNVLFTGGWAHDFATHAPLLAAAIDLAVPDIETEIVDDLAVLAERVSADIDLVTIYACRFRMLDARYTPEQRAEWAMEIAESTRRALTDHVASGRPLLAVHTAAVCFDDWPEWGDLLGGAWSWDRSWHPPPEEMIVRFVADHPIVAGLGVADTDGASAANDSDSGDGDGGDGGDGDGGRTRSMHLVDERYTDLVVGDHTTVLATCDEALDDGRRMRHPVVWCHESAGGRVVYDSLGHDVRSLADPGHLDLIGRSVRWLVGLDTAPSPAHPTTAPAP